MWNVGCRMCDVGCGMRDVGLEMKRKFDEDIYIENILIFSNTFLPRDLAGKSHFIYSSENGIFALFRQIPN